MQENRRQYDNDSSRKAHKVLNALTPTYLCLCGFSALTMNKSKMAYRRRPQVGDDLLLFLAAMHPCISRLCTYTV